MGRKTGVLAATSLVLAVGAGVGGLADSGAEARMMFDHRSSSRIEDFKFLDTPLETDFSATLPSLAVTTAGGTIAALPNERFVAIDADSGRLAITDTHGAVKATLEVAPGAGELALDSKRSLVFVADRMGDSIVVVAIGEDGALTERARIDTPAEPFGLALTPDGKRLLVTTVADRQLVVYDAVKLAKRWSIAIPAEARGVAVSPSGAEAIITHLTSGTVSHVDLKTKALTHTPLNRIDGQPQSDSFIFSDSSIQGETVGGARNSPRPSKVRPHARTSEGSRFARNAFAAAFLPGGIAVVAYQESTPQQSQASGEQQGTYGGGFEPPIKHRIAYVGGADGSALSRAIARAEIGVHQPRALAYDGAADTLYIAGLGNDIVVAIANAKTAAARFKWSAVLPATDKSRCGPTGLAIGQDGHVRVFCSLSRVIATVTGPTATEIGLGDVIGPSRFAADAHAGAQLFQKGSDTRLSTQGAMACSSCHPEGRTDGLTWRIEGHSLQTPLLIGGRLAGTHPFKWDGKDKDIKTSLTETVRRLGGNGISKTDVANIEAFFASLPKPRAPTADAGAIARGEALFRSKPLGCDKCHSGPAYTNGKKYPLAEDLDEVDTPSLIGLASSAPYYHDGSAASLPALLRGKGEIHGMGGIDRIDAAQFDDIVAFLESL